MPMRIGPKYGVLHMGATKDFVLACIRRWGTKDVLVGWTGTDEEAIAVIEKSPREIFATCDCRKDERGACTGEPS